MDQRVEAFIYHAKCTEDICKKVFKNIEKTADLIHDTFDAFAYAVKEYMEENNMDIKVGDTVKAITSGNGYKKGNLYTVADFNKPFVGRFIDVIDVQTGEKGYDCYASSFEKVELPKHEGKILIMVDEKDNNKIIARDLITGKKAEAKCNPKDEWDFNKGAKLAFDRLMEPEKPKEEKGWTGKVICVKSNGSWFTVGKVYNVINGVINYNEFPRWITSTVFTDIETLNSYFSGKLTCMLDSDIASFIEFKGEVTSDD